MRQELKLREPQAGGVVTPPACWGALRNMRYLPSCMTRVMWPNEAGMKFFTHKINFVSDALQRGIITRRCLMPISLPVARSLLKLDSLNNPDARSAAGRPKRGHL